MLINMVFFIGRSTLRTRSHSKKGIESRQGVCVFRSVSTNRHGIETFALEAIARLPNLQFLHFNERKIAKLESSTQRGQERKPRRGEKGPRDNKPKKNICGEEKKYVAHSRLVLCVCVIFQKEPSLKKKWQSRCPFRAGHFYVDFSLSSSESSSSWLCVTLRGVSARTCGTLLTVRSICGTKRNWMIIHVVQ